MDTYLLFFIRSEAVGPPVWLGFDNDGLGSCILNLDAAPQGENPNALGATEVGILIVGFAAGVFLNSTLLILNWRKLIMQTDHRETRKPVPEILAYQHERVLDRYATDYGVSPEEAKRRFDAFKEFMVVCAVKPGPKGNLRTDRSNVAYLSVIH